MQVAKAMPAGIFEAGNLDNFQVGFMRTQANQCLNLEAIAVYLYAVEAIPPKSIVAITQVAKMCPEKHIDKLA